jgi:hypothetical protein
MDLRRLSCHVGKSGAMPNIWWPVSVAATQNSNYFRQKQAYNSGSQALLCAATISVCYDQLK